MSHLKAPWTLDRRGESLVSEGKAVCVWGLNLTWSQRTEEAEANAAFIVKAVNNHYQLLDILKEIEKGMSSHARELDKLGVIKAINQAEKE